MTIKYQFLAILILVQALSLKGEDNGAQQVYTLSSLPSPSSSLVQLEKEKSVVNVETLVSRFRELGGLSGLAYYGAFAYGDASLQGKTTDIFRDLQALHEKYTTTFGGFDSTSKEVIQQLKSAFDQLQEGKQDGSINTLKKISDTTTTLKNSVDTLYQATVTSDDKVAKLRDDAIRIKVQHEEQKKKLQEEKKNIQAEIARMQKEKQNIEAAVNQAKKNADQAKQEADRARRKAKKKKRGIGGFFNKLLGKVKKYEKRERAARNEQNTHEQRLKEHQKVQKQVEHKLAALESQFNSLKTDFNSVDEAIAALQDANKEFKALTVLAIDATTYWDGMQSYTDDLLETLSSAHDEASNDAKAWESPGFQSKAVLLYAKWLALQQQSVYYLENTKSVKALIGSYVSIQQPSPQHAKDMINKIKSGQIAMPKIVKDEL